MNIESFDVLESVLGHIRLLKLRIPERGSISLGGYTNNILLKNSLFKLSNDILFLFIGKKSELFMENFIKKIDFFSFIDVDHNLDEHFCFNIYEYIENRRSLDLDLKDNLLHKVKSGLIVSSTWDGVGGGLFPYITSKLMEWRIDSIPIALIPSPEQPSDAHFNSISSIAMCINKGCYPIFIINRDLLEDYVGVDRKGNLIKGGMILNEILELMLSKEGFVNDFMRFSKYFDIKLYTILISTGCSLKIYDSLENIFNSMLYRMLLNFDLKESYIFYVLARIPVKLRGEITKEKLESAFIRWIREKSSPKVIYISDPIFINEVNDRIDIMIIVGGFNEEKILNSLEEKARETIEYLTKKGIIDEVKLKDILSLVNHDL
ncbi:MAG: hypothetical protein QW638_00585 [Candidatus Bathyarchaeia archaeon]|nr:hypothetical protein [Candidatus Bathyarchaeota archaeon]